MNANKGKMKAYIKTPKEAVWRFCHMRHDYLVGSDETGKKRIVSIRNRHDGYALKDGDVIYPLNDENVIAISQGFNDNEIALTFNYGLKNGSKSAPKTFTIVPCIANAEMREWVFHRYDKQDLVGSYSGINYVMENLNDGFFVYEAKHARFVFMEFDLVRLGNYLMDAVEKAILDGRTIIVDCVEISLLNPNWKAAIDALAIDKGYCNAAFFFANYALIKGSFFKNELGISNVSSVKLLDKTIIMLEVERD